MRDRLGVAVALALLTFTLAGCQGPPATPWHHYRTEFRNDSQQHAFVTMAVEVTTSDPDVTASAAIIHDSVPPGENRSGVMGGPPDEVVGFFAHIQPVMHGPIVNETVPFDPVECADVDPVVFTARLTQDATGVRFQGSLNCPAWSKEATSGPRLR